MITKAPKNVEELVQMRASIVTLPQEISDMRARTVPARAARLRA